MVMLKIYSVYLCFIYVDIHIYIYIYIYDNVPAMRWSGGGHMEDWPGERSPGLPRRTLKTLYHYNAVQVVYLPLSCFSDGS